MRFKATLLALGITAFGVQAQARAASVLQPGEISDQASEAALKAAQAKADSLGAHVCIAVVDGSGILKAFHRMEGAPTGCAESAIKKARAAALFRSPTLNFMKRANGGEPAIMTLPGMVPLGGGTPAKTTAGIWVGAVGSAGSINPNEVQVADAGAEALAQAGSRQ